MHQYLFITVVNNMFTAVFFFDAYRIFTLE